MFQSCYRKAKPQDFHIPMDNQPVMQNEFFMTLILNPPARARKMWFDRAAIYAKYPASVRGMWMAEHFYRHCICGRRVGEREVQLH